MVNKEEAKADLKLAPGPILQSEFLKMLEIAGEGAKWTYIAITWEDDRRATVRSISNLDPIEDATHVDGLYASFDYDDRSELTISMGHFSNNTVTAHGQTARSRLTRIGDYWATIPGRGRVRQKTISSLLSIVAPLVFTLFLIPLAGLADPVARTNPTYWAGAAVFWLALVTICIFVSRTRSMRALTTLIVQQRRTRATDPWTIIGALAGVGALVIAVVTYAWPRS